MQLIGMLDSPYVRRTAIAMALLGLPFEHHAVSVFSTFAQFQGINPVVKAPTLVCDDGTILMDSSLIISYAEALAAPHRLMPKDLSALQHDLHLISLSLAACEKAVQTVYERNLRPAEKQHQPWLDRIHGQLLAAYGLLEAASKKSNWAVADGQISLAMITIAVVWRFTAEMLPEVARTTDYPTIAALSAQMEQLPAFIAYPPAGPGVPSAP